ncbi:MAG: PAS domain-containing protein [Campylobacterales bacterium]|nr:PAS domain-containing protein [Campylobacterales bacterium]
MEEQPNKDIKSDYLIEVIMSEEAVISEVNDYFIKISGYELKNVKGQKFTFLIDRDMPRKLFEDMVSTVKDGGRWEKIVKNRKRNRQYYWTHWIVFLEDEKIKIRQRQASQTEIISIEETYLEARKREAI